MSEALRRNGQPTISFTVHPAKGSAVGSVLLTHGYAEHSGRYGEVVRALTERNLVVATYDLRGHGSSEGHRGHVDAFGDYLVDAHDLLDTLERDPVWRRGGPPVVLGHSLGGLITFHLALREPGRVRGVVLSSPFFGLALHVPALKRLAGNVMSRIAPKFSLPTGLQSEDLTHDPELIRAHASDPMILTHATARWFTEALAAQAQAVEKAPSMTLPTLILAGGDDKVASVDACRALFERVGARTKDLQVLPGQYHEIFNELERDKWIALAADAAARFATTGG